MRRAKKFTRTHFVDGIYEATGMDRKDIKEVVDLFIEALRCALAAGGDIELRGLGSFEVKMRKGRGNARNPRTGKKVAAVRSHGVAAFKPGREVKRAVWNLEGEAAGEAAERGETPLSLDGAFGLAEILRKGGLQAYVPALRGMAARDAPKMSGGRP
ncbi:MAG: integration host factor subunit alpha [Treponematales bacterium]